MENLDVVRDGGVEGDCEGISCCELYDGGISVGRDGVVICWDGPFVDGVSMGMFSVAL